MSEEMNVTETEVTEPTQAELDLASATAIVGPLHASGADDDAMVVALIQEGGFNFKKAGRLLQKALEGMGVRVSAKDRYAQVSELLLENDFAPESWDDVAATLDWLVEQVGSTTEKQALVAVKKFAKDNGIELPAKPKGGGGAGRGRGFRGEILDWLVANVAASDEEFVKFMEESGKPVTMTKRFLTFRETAVKIHNAMVTAGL